MNRKKIFRWILERTQKLNEVDEDTLEVFDKVWDLSNIRLQHRLESNLYNEIYRHCISFSYDWSEDIERILYDSYLELYKCPEEVFLKFLEEILSSDVVPEEDKEEYIRYINQELQRDNLEVKTNRERNGTYSYRIKDINGGVRGSINNLVFGAMRKPVFVYNDFMSGESPQVIFNQNHIQEYTGYHGGAVTWEDIDLWLNDRSSSLEEILSNCTEKNNREARLWQIYKQRFVDVYGDSVPALLPQVYIRYNFISREDLNRLNLSCHDPLRMDYMMIFSEFERIIIEIDGVQHYATVRKEDWYADREKYAQMVRADREFKLRGYDIYRFGNQEFCNEDIDDRIDVFFRRLFTKYGIKMKSNRTS